MAFSKSIAVTDRPDAAPPLGEPSALIAIVQKDTGRVVALYTDVEKAAGRVPGFHLGSREFTAHEGISLSAPVAIGQPWPL